MSNNEVIEFIKKCIRKSDAIEYNKYNNIGFHEKCFNTLVWLEKFKNTNGYNWKPNAAQLNALSSAIKQVDKGNSDVLKGLYEQLKTL